MIPSWRITDLKGSIKNSAPLELHRLKEVDITRFRQLKHTEITDLFFKIQGN